ncbi:MAG: tetratricopeptide repeat protein [Bacteroidetes bacterium]|jgi:serine/threonine-protein kinase|nr:tetratricopeptide repeat protein [Bacteroidota bacterium]
MNTDRWKKIEYLCQEALGRREEDRIAYLKHSCADDPELFDEVKSLLEHTGSYWLEEPLVHMQSSYIFSENLSVSDQMIGPYRLIRPIAAGGMGQVYLAVRNDDQFERFVALKVIHKGGVSDELLDRFYEERQILARLNHSNIARLFDGGTTEDGRPWFAMEYVEDGTPINSYCRNNKLSIEQRLTLFQKVCSAVQYAHQNLIVHHDLKPENILITDRSEPKLLDFGIARFMDLDAPTGPDQDRVHLLTPEYASPEQVLNQPASTTNDIYSLGVILYELISGRLPYSFDENHPEAIRKTVCEQIPPPPSAAAGSDISSSDLDDIILKAINKDQTKRYSSVEQLADDIRRHQQSLPVLAHEPSFLYRAGKFMSRNRLGVAVSGLLVVLVLSFSAVTYIQSLAIEKRAVEVENQRDRAEQVSRFLINLFGSADPSEAGQPTLSAVELLHRGTEKIETELNNQPEIQAELYLVISEVYEQLGLYDRGIEMARQSLDLYKSFHGERHSDIAKSLNAIGWLYRQKGNFEEAETYLQSSLAMRKSVLDTNHPDVARTLNDLGVLKQSMGDYAATDSLLAQALDIRRRYYGDRHESVGVTLSNYAALKWRLGDLETAEEMMRNVLMILKHNLGEENLRVSTAMTNLAAILLSQRKIDEAETFYREALDINYRLVGEEHPDVANGLAHLGNLLRAKGEFEEAEQYLNQSLTLRKKLLGTDHVLVGVSSYTLGELYYDMKQYYRAERQLLSAVDIFGGLFPDGHARTAQVLQTLGELYLERETYRLAKPKLSEALAIMKRVYGKSDERTLELMTTLGICSAHLNETEEAESYLSTALDQLQQSQDPSSELISEAQKVLSEL